MNTTATATQTADQIADRMHAYGVSFEGEVVTSAYHAEVESTTLTLSEVYEAYGRITRVRLLQENGRVDISYIHATLPGGRIVRVNLAHCPSTSLIPRFKVKSTFIEWGKAEGVFAKGLGLLDESTWAVLR